MRACLIVFFLLFHFSVFGNITPGFIESEARDMIAICNSFTFLDIYGEDERILPKHYEKRYTSGVFGMDNKYQIYQKGDIAIFNLRGSTDKKISWLENIHSAMIPAQGTIQVQGEAFNYCFARDTAAAVHSGYALGLAYFARDILYHIEVLNREGIYNFIITGHSQGGALANMLRAYLENLPSDQLSQRNQFKTYAFAAPMVGNHAFANEYYVRYGTDNTSYNIVNSFDPIPKFPLSYKEKPRNFSDYLQSMIFEPGSFSFKDGAMMLFEDKLTNIVQNFSNSVSNQISKDLGSISMPDYVQDINYAPIANTIELPPVRYPKILKDPGILENDSLMAVYKRDSNGEFVNEELYKSEPWSYQHKPYNYYVAFLKKFYPRQYQALEPKYLPENL